MSDPRDRYEEFRSARARDFLAWCGGRKPRADLERLYAEYGDVTSGERLDELEREFGSAAFADARERWRRLWREHQRLRADARTLGVAGDLAAREGGQQVRVGGELRGAPRLEWLGWREADRDTRAEIQRGLERGATELEDLRAELRGRRAGELAEMGFDPPRAWDEALRPDVDLAALEAAAESLLAATEPAYRDALAAGLAAVRVPADAALPIDLQRACALPAWQPAFPSGRIADALDSIAAGLGCRPGDRAGLHFDTEDRPAKPPGARCIECELPGEIHVVALPRGGFSDYRVLFDRTGTALALSFASPSLPVEQRRLGDPALRVAWGELFAGRLFDPEWIERGPLAQRAAGFERDARLPRLARLRFAALRAIAECALGRLPASADVGPAAGAFAGRLGDGLGCDWSGAGLKLLSTEGPGALDELRGLCLAGQLAEKLRERHGRRFWESPRAGDLLKEIWNTGTHYSAAEWADQLELGPLELDFLAREALPG
ncbi:MAG: hypothetical protein J4G09_04530 [Proteobacteria bacterium]|nr:hypothetical protein [Pseudomonadota bacterium]